MFQPALQPLVLVILIVTVAIGSTRTAGAQTVDATAAAAPATASRLVDATGQVEVMEATGSWRPARTGEVLGHGTRLRTHSGSRATIQFSDRSVLRLAPSSLAVIQAPSTAPARKRFRLDLGRLLFFDREAPSDIEFETPVASGAIRGTEFVLTAAADATTLALLDGAIDLRQGARTVALQTGDFAELTTAGPAVKSRILLARGQLVQWALHYPAVVVPEELDLPPPERRALQPSLDAWERGAARRAYELLPPDIETASAEATLYRASVHLSAGEVDTALALLEGVEAPHPIASALSELIAAVRGDNLEPTNRPTTASAWLGRSYLLQSRTRLDDALEAAREATRHAPGFGPAWVRLAELEHSFENRRPAVDALNRGLVLSPDSAAGHSLRGYVELAAFRPARALPFFERALALDGSLGTAWLGLGLAYGQQGRREEARRALQVAATLEPLRAEPRSYLGKGWAESGDAARAREELRLARDLDPEDPTPWLFSALENFQEHRPNEAVRDLEQSIERNDNRAVFRSRLLLDRDLSSRNADLAMLFQSVGLDEPAEQLAAWAVEEDFSNASAHLMLARSLQDREDPLRSNLRLETARQSSLLLANLLAPPGGGNLSQQLSQQDHLRHFGPRPFGLSSLTEYRSTGDWEQLATGFGTVGGLSYALDVQYVDLQGEAENADFERRQMSLQAKQRVSPEDEVYFQFGLMAGESGDTFAHADPAATDPDLRIEMRQEPQIHAGWHRAWSPGHHSLFLASLLSDALGLEDGQRPVPFLRQSGGVVTSVDTRRALFDLDQQSDFDLRSVEYLHIWESPRHGLTAGARYQAGEVRTEVTLAGPLPPPFAQQDVASTLERLDVHADYHWRPVESLRLTGGVGYHHLRHPVNADLAPIQADSDTRDLVAPRLGAMWSPFPRTHLRAAHARSLGGMYFDDSVRLEPTQLAGFTTAPRSLVPESVIGLVPGTTFETSGVGVDQSFTNGLYMGAEVQWVRSDGERGVGAASNALPLPLPDVPMQTRQSIDAGERAVSAYVGWLLEREWSFSIRYRHVDADMTTQFPDIPDTATGLDSLEQEVQSRLDTVQAMVRYQRADGWFGEWRTAWYHQDNEYGDGTHEDEDVWQQDLWGGYRFARRRAEIRLGILNLFDSDHRLQPLTLDEAPARDRTFTASLRLNF